mmetsp:Transcript_27552/g.82721  ORF Transcript_27552/g.82721 Transcript_27552/m.82721 type:complete len:221 (-) Transcript_27552:21-683(-)
MPLIVRIRVPTYEDVPGAKTVTLYPIEVTYDTGKTRRVCKRYRDVLNFHATLLKAAPHAQLEAFNFPHKSLFNTTAEFTKERRRSGFEAYFELLLRLGAPYAPFVVAFLRHGEGADSAFEETGEPRASPALLDALEVADAPPSLVLERPRSAFHWVLCFYAPAALASFGYASLLTALGCVGPEDWARGPAWLAVATAPLVLCVALALFAPLVDDDLENAL